MIRTLAGQRFASIVLALSVCAAALSAYADEPDTEKRSEHKATMPRQWLRQLGHFHFPGEHQRSHASVKAAFSDVVSQANKSTVRVLCDGLQAALGAVVHTDGYILTKASELNGKLECYLSDGRRLDASVVSVNPRYDLAMLKVDAKDLPVVRWSESAAPPVGSWLATTGLDRSPTAIGVVSALPRPSPAPRAVLGVLLGEAERGALVKQVLPGSGAAQAGLQPGDIIRAAGGRTVSTDEALVAIIRSFQPGDSVELSVLREGRTLKITATLGEVSQMGNPEQAELMDSLGGPLSKRRSGFLAVLQHDTVLRPKDCGGPVVDLDGDAVGINIARASRVASYALPADVVKPLLADLMSGKVASAPADEPPHDVSGGQ